MRGEFEGATPDRGSASSPFCVLAATELLLSGRPDDTRDPHSPLTSDGSSEERAWSPPPRDAPDGGPLRAAPRPRSRTHISLPVYLLRVFCRVREMLTT